MAEIVRTLSLLPAPPARTMATDRYAHPTIGEGVLMRTPTSGITHIGGEHRRTAISAAIPGLPGVVAAAVDLASRRAALRGRRPDGDAVRAPISGASSEAVTP
ncbi:MAG TPA: hypothetical protein VFZ79_01795 [Acidimicrobiales bacterium]